MSRGVDVLAVLREQIEASRNSMPHLPEVLHEKIEQAIEEVEAVHAAVAELVEVAEVALVKLGEQAEAIDGEFGSCRFIEQLVADGEVPEYTALRAALAHVRGAA